MLGLLNKHGGYWALASGDNDLFGVTVHFKQRNRYKILYQAFLKASKKDNFSTYPFLQTAAAIDLLTKVVGTAIFHIIK